MASFKPNDAVYAIYVDENWMLVLVGSRQLQKKCHGTVLVAFFVHAAKVATGDLAAKEIQVAFAP